MMDAMIERANIFVRNYWFVCHEARELQNQGATWELHHYLAAVDMMFMSKFIGLMAMNRNKYAFGNQFQSILVTFIEFGFNVPQIQ